MTILPSHSLLFAYALPGKAFPFLHETDYMLAYGHAPVIKNTKSASYFCIFSIFLNWTANRIAVKVTAMRSAIGSAK